MQNKMECLGPKIIWRICVPLKHASVHVDIFYKKGVMCEFLMLTHISFNNTWSLFLNSIMFQAPHQPSQPFKFTVAESCDRIKEEFSFLQAQYHT